MAIKSNASNPRLIVDNPNHKSDIPPILNTKLVPPRLGRGIMPRPRLERLAETVLYSRVTFLRAPPGYGKSTLASIWSSAISAQGTAVTWLSLDQDDQSVQRLMLYLAAALNRVDPALGKSCLNLRAEHYIFSLETQISLLINELCAFGRPLVLFVDNCQVVEDSVLESALGFFLQHAPGNLQVVMLSRRQLPRGLLKHIYVDDLQEIDGRHLTFTLDETRDLLKKAGVELDQASDLLLIQQYTDGWVAALRTFLLSPQISALGQPRLQGRTTSLLFSEQLRELDSSLMPALVFLSLLDSFCEPLLSRLFGSSLAARLLHQLEAREIFLTRLDDSEIWFSLHPMLRVYLKKQCPDKHTEQFKTLLQRAAEWFAGQGLWLDALRLGLEAGQSEQVAGWINNCALDLVERGEFNALLMLEECCDQKDCQAGLKLKLARGWALGLALEGAKAEALLDEVMQDINPEDEASQAFYWEAQSLRAMLLGLADHNHASGPLAQRCYEAAEHRPWITNVLLNLMCCSYYHASNWDAFYTLPAPVPSDGAALQMALHNFYRQSLYALAESAQGRLQLAQDGIQLLLESVDNPTQRQFHRPNAVLLALPHAVLAQISYLRGDHVQTESHLAGSIDFIASGGFLDCMAASYCTQSRLHLHQGLPIRARRILMQLDSLALQHGWNRLRARVLLERVWLNLKDHKPREAIACNHYLLELAALETKDGCLETRFYAHLSSLWLALNGLEQRQHLTGDCEDLLAELSQRQLMLLHAELGLTLGLLLSREGPAERGQCLLDECLGEIISMGAVSLVQDLPLRQAYKSLLAYVSADRASDLAKLLSDHCGVGGKANCDALMELTVKERQIMQLVAEGKSNKLIARDLNVTPETIKSHMKSIFAKLKVESRAQAAVMLQSSQPV